MVVGITLVIYKEIENDNFWKLKPCRDRLCIIRVHSNPNDCVIDSIFI